MPAILRRRKLISIKPERKNAVTYRKEEVQAEVMTPPPTADQQKIPGSTVVCLALANVKVVILDLDLRKGSLSKSVGIGMKKTGVSNYLSGKVDDVKELVQVCGDDNRLHIITSGALPPNPAELLKSGRLDRLLEELKKNYDYILLDNPPYGVVVDTQLCGRLADQTVYVVRSGLFDKRMLPELQELYDSGKMKNMSILLNGIDYVKTGYGYGYGYGYGNYGNDENRKNKKPLYKRIFGI